MISLPKDLQGGRFGGAVDDIVQRIQPDQAVPAAQSDLAPPDINGVGQKYVGTGEIDLHFWLKPVASWFETRGIAALLTMRV